LRVYVGKDNKPAEFSKENVALKGNHFLKVSMAGVKENDFTMVMGYPARTKLYIPSFAIEYLENVELPAKIKIRGEKLRIINEALKARPEIKFRYTARVNSITNNYLRWKGELNGLKRMKLTQQKLEEEKELMAWINADSARIKKYGDIIGVQRDIYNKLIPLKIADIYFNETAISGAELVPFAGKFEKLVQMFNRKKINEKAIKEEVDRLIPLAKQFFESWDMEVDKQMFRDMLFLYYNNVDKAYISKVMVESLAPFDGDLDKYTDYAFAKSMLTKPDSIQAFLQKVDTTTIDKFTADPLYKIALSYYEVYTRRVLNQTKKLEGEQGKYFNIYMDAIASMNANKLVAPD
ncbi:S46 family peptidase, partial [bacterium]|nr:S46 family peptidase [bacterium]